jgi:hypothetical protein
VKDLHEHFYKGGSSGAQLEVDVYFYSAVKLVISPKRAEANRRMLGAVRTDILLDGIPVTARSGPWFG